MQSYVLLSKVCCCFDWIFIYLCNMMQQLNEVLSKINGVLWGWPMIIMLLGTHLFLTIRLRFPQRHILKAFRIIRNPDNNAPGDISQMGALSTSLAATIGTGNIVGVATAIALGGPGAVFWCWITGVLGIATKYAEGLLAVKYRVRTKDGNMLGGPMYAIDRGLGWKWLAVLFSIFAFSASFGIGSSVQSNVASTILRDSFGISPVFSGIIMATLMAMVVLFGVKGITRVCVAVVPFMGFLYIFGCLAVLVVNRSFLLESFSVILKGAFTSDSINGGVLGGTIMMAMRFGIARGLFSNESGLGSAPIVAAAAKTRNPVRQALVSSTSTFWDTVVICLLTGIVIVSSMVASEGSIVDKDGMMITQAAFARLNVSIGKVQLGSLVVDLAIILFTFSTVIGWCYYGEKAIEYLCGPKYYKTVRLLYRILLIMITFAGAVWSVSFVWNIGDLTNALMAIPNLICLLLLSPVIVGETRKYLWNNRLDDSNDEEPPMI